jgi:predicted DsbA family dithiol-disulfide isomerase
MEIEIWSDVACPWCYIGKRRFEAALEQFEHRDDVRVTWRAFELDPDAPHERTGDRAQRLAGKYGITVERAREMEQTVTDAAAGEGLDFRFDIARSGSTLDAHKVIHLAAAHGLQDAMKERLLLAYFTEGELVSDHETLTRLAAEVGLPDDEVRAALSDASQTAAVRDDERDARRLGITSVPTFVVDRALGVSGAHPPDALLALLDQAWAARAPAPILAGGEACGVDGC